MRTARESRGISISEVAEQTRISPLYLEAIEADNYKSLPGGIFNKGFVRSYAKYVGVDEQEALQDYSRLMAATAPVEESEFKTYRPEVLTDDRAASSIVPTIIFAAVILGLMTAGILFLVNYIQNQQSEPQLAANTVNQNVAPVDNRPANTSAQPPAAGTAPAMGALKVEFRTSGEDIWLNSVVDGSKSSSLVTADKAATFEPKQGMRLSYSKTLAAAAQLLINGKSIALPTTPSNPKRAVIEIDLNQNNLEAVWQNASFNVEVPAAAANTNTEITVQTPRATPRPGGTPKPTAAANSNTAAKPEAPPTMTGKPPARPASTPAADKPSNTQER